MALEEEIMKADQESEKEETTGVENPDNLTDEEIESVKELVAMP